MKKFVVLVVVVSVGLMSFLGYNRVANVSTSYLTTILGNTMPSFFIFSATPDFENTLSGEPIIG